MADVPATRPLAPRKGTARIRSSLLRWYRAHRRDLPWRSTRDPYAIWVSEIMLQQTQVETVLPYFKRFLERFPDPATLARATEEQVLSAWSGLGYYRRARSLHAGARVVTERFGGRLPADPDELRALPGIGRYTAGAISSIAFQLAEPILDGNVRRVLSRLFVVDESALGKAAAERRLWSLAGELVSGPDPGSLNQGLMELGALVCKPRDPLCSRCPIGEHCQAYALCAQQRYPLVRPRKPTQRVRVAVAWVRRGSSTLIERRRDGAPLRGQWDLPAIELADDAAGADALIEAMRRVHGLEISVGPRLGQVEHGIMQRRLNLEIHGCRLRRGRVAGSDRLRWVAPGELKFAAVSGATHKTLRLVHDEAAVSAAPRANRGPARTRARAQDRVRSDR